MESEFNEHSNGHAFVQQGDTHLSAARQAKVASLSNETLQLLERDENCFIHQALSTPVMNVLKKAHGAYLEDHDGNRYLDLHGNGVHNIGFNNVDVITAIVKQLEDQLTFTPRRYTAEPTVRFAEQLIKLAPENLNRVLFCPGGSEAIEMAVTLAKHVTGRWKTISFWNQYHGNTFQAATLSGNEHFTSGIGPMVTGAYHVEYPNYYRNPWKFDAGDQHRIDECYLDQMRVVFKNSPDIAAVIGTTISSTPYVPSVYYWQEVRKLCDHYGALLIFDEVVCGMGRTGKMFACEHYVTPDILVMGKSLGGGVLPFAGMLTKEEYNTVSKYSIGHFTHEKSPICSAAGYAALNYMVQNHVVQNAEEVGTYLLKGLRSLQGKFESIGQVDGKGLLISVDLVTSKSTKDRNTHLASSILTYCLGNGLSFKIIDGNILTFRPALIIDRSEADFILGVLESAFKN